MWQRVKRDGTDPFYSQGLLGTAPTRVGSNPSRTTGSVCVCAAPVGRALSPCRFTQCRPAAHSPGTTKKWLSLSWPLSPRVSLSGAVISHLRIRPKFPSLRKKANRKQPHGYLLHGGKRSGSDRQWLQIDKVAISHLIKPRNQPSNSQKTKWTLSTLILVNHSTNRAAAKWHSAI